MAILILLLTVAFALSPLASDRFSGFTAGQFPVMLEDWPIEPGGWAFSIWGVIYAWLIASAVFGLLRRRAAPDWAAMRPALAVSLGVGTFWIAAANASPPLATVMIVVMLIGAVMALVQAGPSDRVWLRWPLGLYAGWLTAATGVAAGVLLGGYGVTDATTAALIVLPFVLVMALVVGARCADAPTYHAAVAWALLGIAVDNAASGPRSVAGLALFGIALVLAGPLRRLTHG